MFKKSKKVGIITLNGYYNYGNRLQNFALEETIRELGCEVETIIVDRTNKEQGNYIIRLKRIDTLQEFFEKILIKAKLYIYRNNIKKRRESFVEFSNKYINETNYSISKDYIPEDLSEKYDYFITGSDQVWNPNHLHGTSFFFLTFAEEQKRIAYAPSFGVSEIKQEFLDDYRKWILGMHRLSVREEDGAKIIKDLIGRDAPVLIDPTLILTRDRWLSIAKEASNKPKGKYLLTYFLGTITSKYKEQIIKIAKKNKLEIINLSNIREKDTYCAGPSEFIDYINSCSILCTDSFHGTVFSILLEKPFVVYERKESLSIYSRINTLLNKFDLISRKSENIKVENNVLNIDYSHITPLLEEERNKSLNYLREALNIL